MVSKVYVVTNVDSGWDCVVGVYLSLELAKDENKGENYIFTEKIINEKEYIEKQFADTSIIKYINEKEAKKYEDCVCIVDTCDILQNRNNLGNTKESITLIVKKYIEFTDCNFGGQIFIVTQDSGTTYALLNINYDKWNDDSSEFNDYLKEFGLEIN